MIDPVAESTLTQLGTELELKEPATKDMVLAPLTDQGYEMSKCKLLSTSIRILNKSHLR